MDKLEKVADKDFKIRVSNRADTARYRKVSLPSPLVRSTYIRVTVSIPITVTVTADITPTSSTSEHSFTSELSGLDLALSRLADFGNVFNAMIDRAWERRNTEKTVEFQDYFDFVWGDLMGEKAAEIMADEVNNFLDS